MPARRPRRFFRHLQRLPPQPARAKADQPRVLREHYTTGAREAAAMAAYVAAVGSDPQAVRQRRPPTMGAGQAPAAPAGQTPAAAAGQAPANNGIRPPQSIPSNEQAKPGDAQAALPAAPSRRSDQAKSPQGQTRAACGPGASTEPRGCDAVRDARHRNDAGDRRRAGRSRACFRAVRGIGRAPLGVRPARPALSSRGTGSAIGGSRRQYPRVVSPRRDQLDPERRAAGGDTRGHRDRRVAGEIEQRQVGRPFGAQIADLDPVHGERRGQIVLGVNRRRRRARRKDEIGPLGKNALDPGTARSA